MKARTRTGCIIAMGICLHLPDAAGARTPAIYFPIAIRASLALYEKPLSTMSEAPMWKSKQAVPSYRLTHDWGVSNWETICFYIDSKKPFLVVRRCILFENEKVTTMRFPLTQRQREDLTKKIREAGFWERPTFSDVFGKDRFPDDRLDAGPWILEGMRANQYHVVRRGNTKIDSASSLLKSLRAIAKEFPAYNR